jgi:peptidoglycan/LPS O-acetylase OafA/YrhL
LDRGAGALAGDSKHLDYIDALRGYAILGVIAVHASLAVPDLHWALRLGRAKLMGGCGTSFISVLLIAVQT